MQSAREEDVLRLVGRTLDKKFQIERFIARGGYGAVFKGVHRELGCPIAVKVLAVPQRAEGGARGWFMESFRKEARTVASLQHPAIVRVLDVGEFSDARGPQPFIVMEWLDGTSLEDDLRARAGRGRSPDESLDLLRPVFDAIAYAHEAAVAHRDLKPSNLMVMPPRRGESRVRVLDFGVAKLMEPDEAPGTGHTLTRDETGSFSLSHAAPEQVGHTRTGPWTDVHALGLLLVEVLVGVRAYAGRSPVELFAAIASPTRPTPAAFGLDVGPWEPILARALALVPGDRHAHAGELLGALEAARMDAQRAWAASTPPPHPQRVSSEAPSTLDPAVASAPSTLRRRTAWGSAALLAALGVGAWVASRPPPPRAQVAAPPVAALPIAPPPVAPPPVAPPPVAPPPVAQPPVARPLVAAPRGRRTTAPRTSPDAGVRARRIVIE